MGANITVCVCVSGGKEGGVDLHTAAGQPICYSRRQMSVLHALPQTLLSVLMLSHVSLIVHHRCFV